MKYFYSRKIKVEEKKNIRKAYLFGFLTLLLIILFFIFGLPFVTRFAAFLTELRTTGAPVEENDTTPPTPPRFESIAEYTNKSDVEIAGSTEPGAIVKIKINKDGQIEVVANNTGRFTHTFTLNVGDNILSAKAYDQAGNESAESLSNKIIFDKDPPSLTITKPEDGSKFFGPRERQLVIEGTTEENASININGRLVVVESDGTFTLVTSLSEGDNKFSIKAQDRAGNITEKTLSVGYSP